MDNYAEVVHQMEAFGVVFRQKDLPLQIDCPKRKGCGAKGKWWYWLRSFKPDAGGSFIVGRFGSYKTSESEKVEINWQPLNDAERARLAAERASALAAAAKAREQEAALAALGAADLWALASKTGTSPYLLRKGVVGESCRYMPNGELLVPLIRYDYARDNALRGLQRIKPDGFKLYTAGFAKPGCAVRLGVYNKGGIVLVCEGYATGLTLRMASEGSHVVYVALDSGNLQHVVPLVRGLHAEARILICADDDWRTRDQQTGQLNNPGKTTALKVAKLTAGVDMVYPIFEPAKRLEKDTDFNDLHARQGLEAVTRQLTAALQAIRRKHG